MQAALQDIKEGYNPRRYYDEEEMQELTRSVRENGVVQPIAVSQQENGGFTVVAGYRRYRAAKAAGLSEIPIHVVNSDHAEEIALIENTVRADMSPAEESDAAMRLIKKFGKSENPIAEVAGRLGWTEQKLRRRMALGLCSQGVRDALAERKIPLGIAELLAGVPEKENQDKALAKIIEHGLGIADVRHLLAKLTQKLDKAIFPKNQCQSCQYNTALQSTLFSEVIAEDAYCTNSTCFSAKTEEECALRAKKLQEEVQTVRLVRMDDAENFTKLSADGANGVGTEQFRACHACQHYGAAIWMTPGHEGETETDICFNLECHAGKVSAAHPAPKPVPKPVPAPAEAPAGTAEEEMPDDNEPGEEESGGSGGCEDGDEAFDAAGSHRPSVALTAAVIDYRRSLWNKAATMTIANDHTKALPVLLALIAKARGSTPSSSTTHQVVQKYAQVGDLAGLDNLCLGIANSGKISNITAAAACSALPNLTHEEVQKVLLYLQPNLADYWTLDDGYLGLLTKSQISVVMDEMGITEKLDAKLFSGKKAEIIQGIMKSGIDFSGLVPENLQY